MFFATTIRSAAVLALSVGLATGALAQKKEFISFGSSASGTSQYVYAGMLIGMARPLLPNVSITNEAVSGTTQNLDLLRRGEIQIAIASPERLHAAHHGLGAYAGKAIPATILWKMNDQASVLFTRADSPIRSIRDLKGRKVAIGPAGSSNEIKHTAILQAFGFTLKPGTKSDFEELTTVKLSHPEAANALAEGAVDATMATQPIPDPSHAELAFRIPLRYVGIEKDMVDKVTATYKWLWPVTVPKGSFKGLDSDLVTLGDPNYIIAHRDNLSEETAYALTRAYVEKLLPDMAKQADYLKPYAADPKLLTTSWAVPGHPGAVKYFTERGMAPQAGN